MSTKKNDTKNSTKKVQRFKRVTHVDAPEELKFNANEGRLQSIIRNILIAPGPD